VTSQPVLPRMTVILFFVDIVNVFQGSVCSSQSHVELGTPCSCMGVPVIWISLWELMLLFVSPELCVAVPDSCGAGERTLLLWELLSGCPSAVVVPCWAKSSGCPSVRMISLSTNMLDVLRVYPVGQTRK
jgi:hypothetical protein